MRYSTKNLVLLFLCLVLSTLQTYSQSIEEIQEHYVRKDFAKVISLGLQALESDPENALVNSVVGRALTDSKKFKEAIPYLIKGLAEKDNPKWVIAWSHTYLGLCYYFTDEILKAQEHFNACIRLNATKNSTQHAERRLKAFQLDEYYKSWHSIETVHFRFHFQNKKDIPDMASFTDLREKAYENINKFFKGTPPKKIDFYVWSDADAGKSQLGKNVGFAIADLCIINVMKNQTRGHEITHILLEYGLHPIIKTGFINEGTATFFDQTDRNRMEVAKEAIAEIEIKVLDLWDNPDKYTSDLNYTVGSAWIEYLNKKGSEAQLKKLLAEQTSAAAKLIYQDFDDLLSEFENALNKK
ncbi:MAG: hypothetical protein EYC69_08465 [Bacteroidetes bacterium]|nr:MAG: hypothetical protein EYC69_08465 [Bacteroidota bacterium]